MIGLRPLRQHLVFGRRSSSLSLSFLGALCAMLGHWAGETTAERVIVKCLDTSPVLAGHRCRF
jgi:hypothetical protein